jgi:hypothetical protein
MYKTFSFLKYRTKCFGSDKISAQVSSFSSRSEIKHCRAGILVARWYSFIHSTYVYITRHRTSKDLEPLLVSSFLPNVLLLLLLLLLPSNINHTISFLLHSTSITPFLQPPFLFSLCPHLSFLYLIWPMFLYRSSTFVSSICLYYYSFLYFSPTLSITLQQSICRFLTSFFLSFSFCFCLYLLTFFYSLCLRASLSPCLSVSLSLSLSLSLSIFFVPSLSLSLY